MTDELGQQLHDRATRGETLSSEEKKQLDAWYDVLDRAEAADLGPEEETEGASLVARVDATLARIADVSQRIRELDARTQTLRQENAGLRLEVARRLSVQRA